MKEGTIRPKEGVGMAQFYEGVMRGYTYLQGMEVDRGPQPPTTGPAEGTGGAGEVPPAPNAAPAPGGQ
jgi:hypothetical protein